MLRIISKFVLILLLSVISIGSLETIAGDKSLILYLPFDEGSGKKTEDKSQYGHHAKLINNCKWVNGKFGKAVEISGKEDTEIVKTGEADTLKIKGEITKMAWVNVIAWTGNLMTVIGKNNHNGGEHSSYGFGLTGQGEGIQAFFGTGDARPTLNMPAALEKGKWLHIAVSYDGKEMKAYLNGKEVGKKADGFKFTGTNDAPVRIGCAKDRGRYVFHGAIDEVVIYSRALTTKEIKDVMEGGLQAVSAREKLALTWGEIKS